MILAQVRLLYACSVCESVEKRGSASLGGRHVGTCCPLDTRQEASHLSIMTVEKTALFRAGFGGET